MKDGRWVTIADSQFAHEKQGLDAVKQAPSRRSPVPRLGELRVPRQPRSVA